ncbi:MAG: hypothetical protein WC304_00865 [Candidatus Gracilibacteria bacterium]
MVNQKKITLSINSVVSWTLKFLMLISSSHFFLVGNIMLGGFSFLMLLVSFIPVIVNRNYNTNLPWSIDFWLTVWLALSVAGEAGFYRSFPWWDDVLHLGGTIVLGYLAFVLVYALNFTGKIKLSIPLIGFFTFMIGMAFGGMWEISEFWVWHFTGADSLAMQGNIVNGFYDTFSDLQFDLLGSAFIAVVGMWYVAHQRHVKLRVWMKPFIKIFGEEIKKVKETAKRKLHHHKRKIIRKVKKSKTK